MVGCSGAGGTRLVGGVQVGRALGGPSASGACGERRARGGRGLAPGSGPSARCVLRGTFTAARLSFIFGSFRTRRAPNQPYLSLVTVALTPPVHPSNPISGRILFVALVSLWPLDPCFVFHLCPQQTQHKAWHRAGNEEMFVE